MCTSFYLGALRAAVADGRGARRPTPAYEELYEKGRRADGVGALERRVLHPEDRVEGPRAGRPQDAESMVGQLLARGRWSCSRRRDPSTSTARAASSDGVLGAWIAAVCGVGSILDDDKVASHLRAVHRYNLRHDLSDHANPQRPTFACGRRGRPAAVHLAPGRRS